MKVFFKVSLLILSLITNSANSQEDADIKQFDDWQLVCAKIENVENCEVNQVITVEESDLQFKIVYQILIDEKTKKNFDVFSIITPLGVNLTEQAALIFPNSEEQINVSFIKCEVFGCILTMTDLSENTKDKEIFSLVKKRLSNSDEFTLGFGAFYPEPMLIKSSLKGFNKSLNALKKK